MDCLSAAILTCCLVAWGLRRIYNRTHPRPVEFAARYRRHSHHDAHSNDTNDWS